MLNELLAALLPVLPLLLAASIAAGLIAGLFGLGGGIVIVPLVFFLLGRLGVEPGLAMSMAVATSMAAIIPTGLMSAFTHNKFSHVEWPVVRLWALPLAVGVAAGSTLIVYFRTPWLIVVFGIFLLLVAAYSFVKLRRGATPKRMVLPAFRQSFIAALIGFISALVGVGGGTMSVPVLQLMGLDAHRAVGTSSALGVVIAVVATVWMVIIGSHLPVIAVSSVGLIYWPALVVMLPIAMISAPVGASVAKRLPARKLTQGFCLLLVVIATRMLWVALRI